MIRLLTFTTLFPSAAHPTHGLFVERRLRHIVATGRASARVIAPVPWFPSTSARFGRLGVLARTPASEERHGIPVSHPRFPAVPVPRIGAWIVPYMMARCTLRHVQQLAESIDLIDAHFLYPDGVAAAMIAKRVGKPLVLSARGSDVNTWPEDPVVKRRILKAVDQAAATISVSQALKDEMEKLGVAGEKVHVIRNGVDLDHFNVGDRTQAKRQLGLHGPTILCVGHLDADKKGQDLVIEALPLLPNAELMLVGYGPSRSAMEDLCRKLGVEDRVHFAGAVSPDELPLYYAAADVFVLASRREGMPNVVLEALACGIPVVATRVGGVGEIVNDPRTGTLLDDRDVGRLAQAISALIEAEIPPEEVRSHAEQFSWAPIAATQADLYESVLAVDAAASKGDSVAAHRA